ncbi:MAG: formate dehydrogenase accessory sulfurtransferase FdhD [Verrucomicrobia bacterium]|jgi:FdhD protein|nr:formate dehydrogenase accessory sulfurtransferase FdhD [Verrucomicrobiota bacterium]
MEGRSALNPSLTGAGQAVTSRSAGKYSQDAPGCWAEDRLAIEEPLEIRLGGKSWVVTLRSPGADHDLVAGLLWTEGVVTTPSDILELAHCEQGEQVTSNIMNAFLKPGLNLEGILGQRGLPANASCGLCGKVSIESVHRKFPVLDWPGRVPRSIIYGLERQLRPHQQAFASTGGVHAAALFDESGRCQVVREDVGRHNAVDKVIGSQVRAGAPTGASAILLVTSRASFEIVQKALSARIPIIACASAPSSLAVDFAQANGQTLIGFLREGRFNLYTHPERLAD